jgi:hypothetical protein
LGETLQGATKLVGVLGAGGCIGDDEHVRVHDAYLNHFDLLG